MLALRARLRTKAVGKSLGAAAFPFFFVKGLVWLVLAAAGYAAWTNCR